MATLPAGSREAAGSLEPASQFGSGASIEQLISFKETVVKLWKPTV